MGAAGRQEVRRGRARRRAPGVSLGLARRGDRRQNGRDDESGVGTGNWDTGESHPAGRDLDHTNPDVRATVKGFLRRLKAVGFKGWRYDLVKGYHPRFVGEYNDATAPGLSVGEFFDGD